MPEDDDEVVAPSAIMSTSDGDRHPLEIADLDCGVLSVLLDAVRPDVETQIEEAARAWDVARLQLVIHPLLDAMATWGRQIPRSVVNEVRAHRAAMGLSWSPTSADDPSKVRATGARFDAAAASPEARRAALHDALAVGGGDLELVDSRGKVHQRVSERLMDLDAGLVGPRHAIPAHFRRLDRGGACPMCRGRTVVTHLDRDLLVARPSGSALDEKSLDSRASAILKGVWRSEVVPFFRRLADEDLWDADARWTSLDAATEATVMHGFWIRPSHGTFLKTGSKNDGSEVGHWLRWDGLVSAVDGQLERSKDARWRDAVNASRREVRCPMCRGAGVGPNAALLEVGGKTLDAWMRGGDLDAFLDALEALPRLPPRAARERKRVAYCVAPLRSTKPALSRPATGPAVEEVLRRASDQFAAMTLVAELKRVRTV